MSLDEAYGEGLADNSFQLDVLGPIDSTGHEVDEMNITASSGTKSSLALLVSLKAP